MKLKLRCHLQCNMLLFFIITYLLCVNAFVPFYKHTIRVGIVNRFTLHVLKPQKDVAVATSPKKKPTKRSFTRKVNKDSSKTKEYSIWRLYNIGVPLSKDPGKDHNDLHPALLQAIGKVIKTSIDGDNCVEVPLPHSLCSPEFTATDKPHITVVRKSFDCREKLDEPTFVYTVDVMIPPLAQKRISRIIPRDGAIEQLSKSEVLDTTLSSSSSSSSSQRPLSSAQTSSQEKVLVVGAGPAGLFAALRLLEAGLTPVVLERGKGVEKRGQSIGALFNRKLLDPESNLCYGEGGAGTWSDGKLTTRIGKNSREVRSVLETLVRFGAPRRILVDGKPHLGTDRLVRILKNMRTHLLEHGAEIRFDARVEKLVVQKLQPSSTETSGEKEEVVSRVTGVCLSTGERIDAAHGVVLAVGHSARGLYTHLHDLNVSMVAKPIAVGFRIEHPQELINTIQYGANYSALCERGQGRIPVADYRLAVDVHAPVDFTGSSASMMRENGEDREAGTQVDGNMYAEKRGCYSFCMCPGGQIVPTTVRPEEICINGMSFSKRQSAWANSALVVAISPYDIRRSLPSLLDDEVRFLAGKYAVTDTQLLLDPTGTIAVSTTDQEVLSFAASFRQKKDQFVVDSVADDVLHGVWWQRLIERRASRLGGGNLVVPVQRATDFVENRAPAAATATTSEALGGGVDTKAIASSYRLGVREAACHEIYPDFITRALQQALRQFDRKMPGFLCKDAILHGVETRTSAPLQITRDSETCASIGLQALYPTGEGAGYAGGIISAAVDGLRVAQAIASAAVAGDSGVIGSSTTTDVAAVPRARHTKPVASSDHFY